VASTPCIVSLIWIPRKRVQQIGGNPICRNLSDLQLTLASSERKKRIHTNDVRVRVKCRVTTCRLRRTKQDLICLGHGRHVVRNHVRKPVLWSKPLSLEPQMTPSTLGCTAAVESCCLGIVQVQVDFCRPQLDTLPSVGLWGEKQYDRDKRTDNCCCQYSEGAEPKHGGSLTSFEDSCKFKRLLTL
jgi:hypothetical protein